MHHANTQPARYQAKLVSRPLLTQVVTTAILFGTGDVIAQQAVDKKGLEKHDLARTGRMFLYGGGELSLFCLIAGCQPASLCVPPAMGAQHEPAGQPRPLSPPTQITTNTPQQPSSAQPQQHGTNSSPKT